MEQVSGAWKENQAGNLVSKAYVEATVSIADPDAQMDARAAANGEEMFSHAAEIVRETEKAPVKYATLERNSWTLDGSRILLDPTQEDYGEQGYIGTALSGADGTFAEGALPTVTISFSQEYRTVIPGITVTWSTAYHEWAARFRVTAYNGSDPVTTREFENGELTSVADMDISGYDRITVEVLEWSLPYHRARVEGIIIGVEQTYAGGDLLSYRHVMAVDPLSATLPKNEITFELKNLENEFNPYNPVGMTKYLIQRQSVTVRYGYRIGSGVEWIKAGTFYMSEWDTPQNGIKATFKARDAFEFMGDVYTGPVSGTLGDIARAAFTQANLPAMGDGTVRWYVDESLDAVSVPSGVDLDNATIAATLQYCANAGCCVLRQLRDGTVRVEPLPEGESDYTIGRFNSYKNSEISLSKQLRAVNVNNGQYILSVGEVGETQPVNNPLISDSQAPVVAAWVAEYLKNRTKITGEYRADPRLDALDRVVNTNQFSESMVLVTEIQYSYNGAFRGSYEGRQGV